MRKMMIAGAAALALGAAPAVAQVTVDDTAAGLVNVTIPVNVLNDSLNENEIELLTDNAVNVTAPVSVQVPIGIAANLCGITANVLVADLRDDGEAECTAQNASQALGRQILRQKVRQNR